VDITAARDEFIKVYYEGYTDELVELWDKALKSAVGNNASARDTAAMGDVYT